MPCGGRGEGKGGKFLPLFRVSTTFLPSGIHLLKTPLLYRKTSRLVHSVECKCVLREGKVGEIEEGKEISGDGRRLDLGW